MESAPDRRAAASTTGSATAEAFGAEVSLRADGRSLFLVVGHEGPPDAAVHSVGGSVVTHLQEPRRALAIAPLAAHAELRAHRDLELAGPVSVEPRRFERFCRLVGLGEAAHPMPRTSKQPTEP